MQIILSLLFLIVCFGSLIITFTAIIKILSNDFNGSKPKWILIFMIGIFGPILWLTKGKKLLVKKGHQEFVEAKEKFDVKQHYLEMFKNIGIPLILLFILSIFLIAFGYFVRLFDIYFFWESTSVGFGLFLITLVKFFIEDADLRKEKEFNRVFCYAVIVVLSLTLFFKILITVIIFNSNAYIAAKRYLKEDLELASEVGKIQSFSFLPNGSMSIQKDEYGTVGSAVLTIVVKGENKYVEKNVVLKKELEEDWVLIHQD